MLKLYEVKIADIIFYRCLMKYDHAGPKHHIIYS